MISAYAANVGGIPLMHLSLAKTVGDVVAERPHGRVPSRIVGVYEATGCLIGDLVESLLQRAVKLRGRTIRI
jgi:hypothetical protein